MTDKMDVDASGSETISPSSSFEKLDTAKLDLDALNQSMQNHCNSRAWDLRIERAEHNATVWQPLISDVLVCLTATLVATDAKSSFIAEPNDTGAKVIVEGFNEKELEEWKVGVQRGVEMNDWSGLITHRTYISDYRMFGSHVIATTVKLRKRKVPNVSLGVPIEYSAFDCFPFHSAIMLTSRLSFVA
jgi:hypothetical protein